MLSSLFERGGLCECLDVTQFFIFGSFHDAFSGSDYTASNGKIITELERMWKEAVFARFVVLILS
jgi:hypothetical protein